MAEPGVSADQQISALYAEADRTMERFKDRLANIQQVQQQAMQAGGEATSQDGSVRVAVDATGVVTSVSLTPTVFERTTPQRLAQTVVATIQSAAAQARGKTSAAMAENKPEEGMSAQAAEALAAYGIPKIGVPEVPRTAADPTTPDTWDDPQPVNTAAQEAWASGHATEPEPEPQPAPEPIRVARAPRAAARSGGAAAEDWASGDERPW